VTSPERLENTVKNPRHPVTIPALVLLGVLALTACAAPAPAPVDAPSGTESGPDAPAPDDDASAGVDVCALLSGVDTAALVKVEMDAGTSQGDACVVEPVDSASTGSLRVQFVATGGAARYEQQRELLGVSSEVPGFGDAAFLTGTWLLAVRGDEFLSVQVVPDIFAPGDRLTDAQVIAASETVAFNAGW
jgi:hypothetical protein